MSIPIYHYLKTEREYYELSESGIKNFEIRKNDRNFRVGDYIILSEIVNGELTGQEHDAGTITYVFEGGKYGLDKDYCIIQLERNYQ